MQLLGIKPDTQEFILLLDKGKFEAIHDDLQDEQLKKEISLILDELPN